MIVISLSLFHAAIIPEKLPSTIFLALGASLHTSGFYLWNLSLIRKLINHRLLCGKYWIKVIKLVSGMHALKESSVRGVRRCREEGEGRGGEGNRREYTLINSRLFLSI